MKLYIKQKVFSWNDKFSVVDEYGNDCYTVEGEMFSFGKKLHVYDMDGMEVAYIEQKLFTFKPRYHVYICGEQVAEIVKEMNLNPGQMGLIVNRAPEGKLDDGVMEEIQKHGLQLLGVLPQDDGVYRCDCQGEPSARLPESNPVKTALMGIMKALGL